MDIGLFIVDGCIDIIVEEGDLRADNGLQTAVILSVFLDKRATIDEVADGETNRRGWWADPFDDLLTDEIGSKLWLRDRSKKTDEDLTKMEIDVSDSLAWMLTDGIAAEINVVADNSEIRDDGAAIKIEIVRPDGTLDKFKAFWDQTEIQLQAVD